MPTGKVKWYDVDKGFGFLSRDDGGDVYVHKAALPPGVEKLRAGERVEFGIAAGRKGDQALSVRLIAPPPSVAKAAAAAARRSPDELHSMIEDMIKLLDDVQHSLRRGRYPDRRTAHRVAKVVHAVANELEH
ncbi:MAG: cold-shock protein [Frankia sp.]|nr:cold-shock protein [Frankia sp.]